MDLVQSVWLAWKTHLESTAISERRDSGDIYIRIDYSNEFNYWKSIVQDDPAKTKRDGHQRFYSSSAEDWKTKFDAIRGVPGLSSLHDDHFRNTIVSSKADSCKDSSWVNVEVSGDVSEEMKFGYFFVGTISPTFNIEEAYGFFDSKLLFHGSIDVDARGTIDAARTDNLTEAEAIIVLNTPFGDSTPEDQREMTNQKRWSPSTKKKFHDALELLLTAPEMNLEKTARTNADIAFDRIKALRKPEIKNFSIDDLKNITGCNSLPWVEGIEKHLERQPAWGFACIRISFGEDSSWETFKEFVIHATESALTFPRNFPSVRPLWKIQWIEDPSMKDASVVDLCRALLIFLATSDVFVKTAKLNQASVTTHFFTPTQKRLIP
ncbi:uncharacterized protein N7487_006771 [Penicillium crustosum]|uniref:uncharacterized protein n=1 Tax=Penicillium crustosum TaxID=36656 RepID=UPI00238C861D|nr:uncharacterized protein N7487_006771 [Penicillium crustosum]KAJ5412412.1 hypothetical protein N7487_006771 [Penicillium crustosum]